MGPWRAAGFTGGAEEGRTEAPPQGPDPEHTYRAPLRSSLAGYLGVDKVAVGQGAAGKAALTPTLNSGTPPLALSPASLP